MFGMQLDLSRPFYIIFCTRATARHIFVVDILGVDLVTLEFTGIHYCPQHGR